MKDFAELIGRPLNSNNIQPGALVPEKPVSIRCFVLNSGD
jgi:hypothetical protein